MKMRLVLLVLIVTGLATTSFASDKNRIDSVATAHPVVEYIGSDYEHLFFTVKFDNNTADRFDLEIRDKDGFILYTKEFAEKNFTKKIALNKENEAVKVSIIIKSGESKGKQLTYELSSRQKMVEEIVVTKM